MKGFELKYTIDNWSGIMTIDEAWEKVDNKKIGVYFFYNENKELIYIGKSSSAIRQRLNTHCFQRPSEYLKDYQLELLLKKREEFRFFSYSEVDKDYIEAVEFLLIKNYKPKFNILG